MSYSQPDRRAYAFGSHDFGAGGESLSVKGPAGKKGKLIDICVSATETFNAVTTEGFVNVGTGADPDAYASFGLGTLADTDSALASTVSGDIIDPDIPADTQVEVTFVAPTGGTPAGIGYVNLWIDWF